MNDLLPFLVVGLVTGSLYGLAGIGLVLTYKTSGIFNFAHGAVAMTAAYAFYELHILRGLPWPIAMALAVIALGALVGMALERLARALASVSVAMQVVATVGLLIAIQAAAVVRWGAESRSVPPFLPIDNISLAQVNVGIDQAIVVLVTLVSAAGLYLFLRGSRIGISMQAVVDDPELLATGGTSPQQVRTLAWIIGSTFACLSGVLLVPFTGLDATILTLLVVQAFGAAAVGAFSSLPLTYIGGLVVGTVAAFSTRFIGDVHWLSGFPPAVPFLILFVVLLVMPRHRLVEAGALLRLRVKPPPMLSMHAKIAGLVVLSATLIALPHVVGTRLPVFTSGLVFVIVFLSLHLLVRLSGQVSLAHASLAAVGAAAFSHLGAGLGLPWLPALLGAGLAAIPVGALVAIPAIRLSGLYLAIATFGFGVLLSQLVYPMGIMFGASGARSVPRPTLWGLPSDTGYYYVVLVVAAVMGIVTAAVMRNRIGRLLRGMADSPVALSTLGTNVNVTRIIVFCLSAFMAGIAGALFGALTGSVSAAAFSYFHSLEWLVVFVIAGSVVRYAPIPTALLAGFLIAVVPSYFQSPTIHDYLPILFGLAAVAHALASDRFEGFHRLQAATEAAASRRGRSPVADRVPREPTPEKVTT